MIINLNKSHLQEIPLSSGMGPLLHRLQGDLCSGAWSTSSPSSFFSHLGVCRAVFHTFFPHSSLVAAFCPFFNAFFPEALPRGCAVPGCGAAAEPSGTWRAAPLLTRAPVTNTSPHIWQCDGSANATLFHIVLAKDVLREPSFSIKLPCFRFLVPETRAQPSCGGWGASSPEAAAWL